METTNEERADVKDSYLRINIADGFSIAIARLEGDPRILLQLMLTDDRVFDDYRPPLLLADGAECLDFGSLASAQRLLELYTDDKTIMCSFGKKDVSGVIWQQGQATANAALWKFLRAGEIKFQLYLSDYSIAEYRLDRPGIEMIAAEVKERFR